MPNFTPEKILDIGARDGYFTEYNNKITGTEVHASILPNYTNNIVLDDECIDIANSNFDLVLSMLNNHFINDLPGHLIQVKNILASKGMYICTLFGGRTLHELRDAILNYEINENIGVSPHISPMIDIREMAALMQRAGFAGATVDINTVEIEYNYVLELMRDLKGMGEGNCLIQSNYFIAKNALPKIDMVYKQMNDGKITATFEIITATGFKN